MGLDLLTQLHIIFVLILIICLLVNLFIHSKVKEQARKNDKLRATLDDLEKKMILADRWRNQAEAWRDFATSLWKRIAERAEEDEGAHAIIANATEAVNELEEKTKDLEVGMNSIEKLNSELEAKMTNRAERAEEMAEEWRAEAKESREKADAYLEKLKVYEGRETHCKTEKEGNA